MTRTTKPGLLLAALLLTACGGADGGAGGGAGADRAGETASEATGPAEAQVATVVSNDRLEFEPATVNAKVGALELTHRNGGSVPHNLVFTDEELGGTEVLTGGKEETLTVTFTEPGTYEFVCTIHSGQEGEVVVS